MSLFQMMSQRPAFAHISTAIPTLDSMMPVESLSCGIFDLQTVPGLNAAHAILCNIVLSHLSHNPSINNVVIIDCFNPFPWQLLFSSPRFKPEYSKRISSYRLNRFIDLLAFFTSSSSNFAQGTTIVIINDLYDLLELYKLELASIYKQSLLKNHLLANSIALANAERIQHDPDFKPPDPTPPSSDLLSEHPLSKADAHMYKLFDAISKKSVQRDSLVFLTGNLTTKYCKYSSLKSSSPMLSSFHSQNSSPAPMSANNSMINSTNISANNSMNSSINNSMTHSINNPSRLTTHPSNNSINNLKNSTSNSTNNSAIPEHKNRSAGRQCLIPSCPQSINRARNQSIEAFLTSRLVFYKDWYHKSTHHHCTPSNSDLRMVFAVQVNNLHIISINEPVYFDYNDEFYASPDPDALFVDLSRPPPQSSNHPSSPRSQSREKSADSTETALVPEQQQAELTQNHQSETAQYEPQDSLPDTLSKLPSSPNMTTSQIKQFFPVDHVSELDIDTAAQEFSKTAARDDHGDSQASVIEASDDELVGSILLPPESP